MTEPFVGLPAREDHAALCAYSDKPGDPLCLAEATWHGFVADEHGQPAQALTCCDQHKRIMEYLATWVHQHDTPCALPDSLFYPELNICAVPWVELERALTAAEPLKASAKVESGGWPR